MQVFIDKGIDYSFYHINDCLLPDETDLFSKIKKPVIVLLISYFGIVSMKRIAEQIKKASPDSIVIVDDVQNYYGIEYKDFADYRFTSYRKWFAVPDGAEVYSRNGEIKPNIRKNSFAQYKFAGNILKNYSNWVDDKICLDLLDKGEAILDSEYDVACSEISRSLINNIPFDEIKRKRKENAAYLHRRLTELGIRHLYNKNSVPLFMPVFLQNRAEVRRAMFANSIFTPVHWPYESEKLNGFIKNRLYDTELSLICDQRYSEDDMEKQISIIREFI
ncbi:MAG: hypothetical protein J6K96_06740 [Treponema sp.]|nr:hypothetical protein [Treponema sp.]